ncbi:MAG: ZIP family metal transporter [Patescibacteria group bacterium]|nr:ZIP family metal transporter [Patescibacteria group bacterium]
MVFLFALFTFISTLLGGIFALRHKDKMHLILGFTSGVVVAVALFDVLPEVVNLSRQFQVSFSSAMVITAVSFLFFHIAQKSLLLHSCEEEDCQDRTHKHVGVLGASGFSLHSFIDGVAMGTAFSAGTQVGLVVALAIISHDFSDGLNTVTILLRNKNTRFQTISFLLLDATTPVLGVIFSLLFSVSEKNLLYLLSFFTGFFLYMGASDLLPEAHHQHSSYLTMFMTVLGFVFIFAVNRIITL